MERLGHEAATAQVVNRALAHAEQRCNLREAQEGRRFRKALGGLARCLQDERLGARGSVGDD